VSDACGPAGAARPSGEVLWFSQQKGWGIVRDEGGRRVLVDYAAIGGEGLRSLRPGQQIDLDVVETPHGPVAERVVPRG
jgi:CspA family cold shock protein